MDLCAHGNVLAQEHHEYLSDAAHAGAPQQQAHLPCADALAAFPFRRFSGFVT
jgi:hypothetical protein